MTGELVAELRRRIYGWTCDALVKAKTIEEFWRAKGGIIALEKVLEYIGTTEDEILHPPAPEIDEQE